MNFKDLIPGGRIVKTALAVLICLILAYIIDYDYPIYAVIAGVLMMKESSDETKWAGFNRMKGTVLG
ncbi:MAG: FUSC family protein, partial [Erysipelothrix sp.]|nr:FUSC family protein [Erysipelothrix sp.]